MTHTAPDRELKSWLAAFDDALARRDVDAALDLFQPDGFWRDYLALTWNLHTAEGHGAIRDMLQACLAWAAPGQWQAAGGAREADGLVEGVARFETTTARCDAVIRLRNGKAWTLLTSMTELKGHEPSVGRRRPPGHPGRYEIGQKSWRRQREQEAAELGIARQPYCVILGAGQSGLSLGARLKQLGVSTLLIDRSERPSDTWRRRHESLALHSPCWYDEMPHFRYPESWPVYPSKDQFANWLDAYPTLMELDVWTGSDCRSAEYDDARGEWRLTVVRDGRSIEIRPKQFVIATSFFSAPSLPQIPGARRFKGELRHASTRLSAEDYAGKRCVVVGSGTSGHDLCAELWQAGADVTMIQRSPTIVIRLERLLEAFSQIYGDEAQARGITTELADLLFTSTPLRVLVEAHRRLVAHIREQDALFYERLRKAGFLLTFGEDEAGILPQILREPTGYYIDVGASELIANGSVKLKSGVSVEEIGERAVFLNDGSELPAEVVVFATGYDRQVAGSVLPESILAKVGRIWGFGSGTSDDPGPWEGELRNMWKPTPQPGLWFHRHGIAGGRIYSRLLALQIKAREAGLPTRVYAATERHRNAF